MPDSIALPDGSRLLHIGPHKTGSTAIQDALHQARPQLAEQGVTYLSRNTHESTPARYVTDRLVPGQDAARAERRWAAIAGELRGDEPGRKVYSSEFLSDATVDQVQRIASDVGTERTSVVVTLRSLASILPSQYQQYLQRGTVVGYEAWLDAMFNQPPYERPTPSFWKRHRHDELVERWADVVGPERVIVVMVDGRDFTVAPRAFEQLLGLTDGTLTDKVVTANRSMTWGEAEVMRRYNQQFKAAGLPAELHLKLMNAAGSYVKERVPTPGEAKIATPEWAVERANETAAEMAESIKAMGVRVLGDLSLMSSGVAAPAADPPVTVDAEIAARFAMGFTLGANRVVKQAAAAPRAAAAAPVQAPGMAARIKRRIRRTLTR